MNYLQKISRFVKFWLPTFAWMALIFPLTNRTLSTSRIFNVFMKTIRLVFPHIDEASAGIAYIIFRKLGHFVGYGLLAYLLFRAFRGNHKKLWEKEWALKAGGLAIIYGFFDELFQSWVPGRNSNLFDLVIDSAGIITMLMIINWNSRKKARILNLKVQLKKRPSPATIAAKRIFDVILSSFGLIFSIPFWPVIAVLIMIEDGRPVFYKQERVGRNGRIFKTLKFRSMVKDAEKEAGAVQAAENDPRVTRIGRILRATALDELPQLYNIFIGDMSFVGPRALRPAEKEIHGHPEVKDIESIPGCDERHTVRPGLTGLAQVFLPTDVPRRKKFKYDLLYIRKMNIFLDFKLILLSFWVTFRAKWESRSYKL